MGIIDFFRKVGSGIKNGLKAGMDFVGNKVLPTVNKFAQPVLGIMSALPGPLGTIGKVGSGILGTVNSIAKDDVPNEGIAAKIGKAAEGINGTINAATGENKTVQERVRQVDPNNVIGKAVDVGKNIIKNM